MATDPDRQSDGRPARRRGRTLSAVPIGLHGAFQIGWALALAFPLAARVEDLFDRPHAGAGLAVIEVSTVWALIAALAWMMRVLALSSCGTWGARARRHVRDRRARRTG